MIEFISRLPQGYQEVEYIESSGTQYIDTGFVVNKSDNYVLEIDGLFPSQAQTYQGCNGYMQFFVSSKYGISNESSISVGNRDTVRIAYANQTATLTVNGSQAESKSWASYSGADVKLGVLRMGDPNNGWFSGGAASGTIYGYKVWKNNILVSECVPCVRNSDNVAGVYDVIREQFITNAGSGIFAVGSNMGEIVITPGGVISFGAALRRRMMMTGGGGAPISDLPLGALINVGTDGGDGAPNYEIADKDNLVSGGIVLVRKNVHSTSEFGSTVSYPNSTLDNLITTTIYNQMPSKLRDIMMDVSFPLYSYLLSDSENIIRKMFALTYIMVGFYAINGVEEGKALQLYTSEASRKKTFKGNGREWWLSSQDSKYDVMYVTMFGGSVEKNPSSVIGVVPAFVIPSETPYNATPNTDGSYNLIL